MDSVDGFYTAYMAGAVGQGLALFGFKDGKISGADIVGLVFSGEYKIKGSRVIGQIIYRMPAGSVSITGVSFESDSGDITVPIDLPIEIDPNETFLINTPHGPLNVKLVKNVGFD